MKKFLNIFLIFVILLGRLGGPLLIYAEGEEVVESAQSAQTPPPSCEPSPSSDPTPDPSSEPAPSPLPDLSETIGVGNEATASSDVSSTAISGENEIVTPAPSPTPSDEGTLVSESSPSPSPNPEEYYTDSLPSSEQSTSQSGETLGGMTSVPPPANGPSPSPSPLATTVESGDAVSVVEAQNSVNSTEVNSNVTYQTINIFTSGDVDLSGVALLVAHDVVVNNKSDDPTVNILLLDANNYVYLSNDVTSVANSGDNSVEGGRNASINTGDAYSAVSLLNEVNTTILDSEIHIVTINIYGDVEGNIILPEFSSATDGSGTGGVLLIGNSATVVNNIDSEAISGQNSIESQNGGEITTGDAASAVNLVNIVNTSIKNFMIFHLSINTFGEWIGTFLGWGQFGPEQGGNLTLTTFNGTSCGEGEDCQIDATIANEAYLSNNVSSLANSGGNSISGVRSGDINTGNAFSSVSIMNLVNTTIKNSIGFWGFINIFGTFRGNIGGASYFEEEAPPIEEAQAESGPSQRESGGQLEVTQKNNVGTHVLPGDTVTFSVSVKNTGTGKVYDSKLRIGLIDENGVDMGGANFNLGDIKPGEGFKINTGLVLSKSAKAGEYTAHAVVIGTVGPDDSVISAYADSFFPIKVFGKILTATDLVPEAKAEETQVLAASTESDEANSNRNALLYALLGSLPVLYFLITKAKRRLYIPPESR